MGRGGGRLKVFPVAHPTVKSLVRTEISYEKYSCGFLMVMFQQSTEPFRAIYGGLLAWSSPETRGHYLFPGDFALHDSALDIRAALASLSIPVAYMPSSPKYPPVYFDSMRGLYAVSKPEAKSYHFALAHIT